jgi:hypothetical protein
MTGFFGREQLNVVIPPCYLLTGPLISSGDLEIRTEAGELVGEETRHWLSKINIL